MYQRLRGGGGEFARRCENVIPDSSARVEGQLPPPRLFGPRPRTQVEAEIANAAHGCIRAELPAVTFGGIGFHAAACPPVVKRCRRHIPAPIAAAAAPLGDEHRVRAPFRRRPRAMISPSSPKDVPRLLRSWLGNGPAIDGALHFTTTGYDFFKRCRHPSGHRLPGTRLVGGGTCPPLDPRPQGPEQRCVQRRAPRRCARGDLRSRCRRAFAPNAPDAHRKRLARRIPLRSRRARAHRTSASRMGSMQRARNCGSHGPRKIGNGSGRRRGGRAVCQRPAGAGRDRQGCRPQALRVTVERDQREPALSAAMNHAPAARADRRPC